MLLYIPALYAQRKHSPSSLFMSYKGLVMAGYQGWFNAPGDGAGRGWNHYVAHGKLEPGNCKFDLWPATGEYKKTYETPFIQADGSAARLFSSYDASAVDLHFSWMRQYGIDGVFVQRFISNVKNPVSRRHNNTVLANALTSARKYRRAIAVMYDLSGMKPDDYETVINDWKYLVDSLRLTSRGRRQTYLYHRGKPLVAIWGAGFNDHRAYGTKDVERIIDFLKNDPEYGGCAIMLGVPAYWRDFGPDTEKDPNLTEIIRKSDIVHPWFVGRYNDSSYEKFWDHIKGDVDWCRENGLDYAPVVFPGFSWHNMYSHGPLNQISRDKGQFYQKQIDGALQSGAEMLYVAMFDEIDEGTAIFKCSKNPPDGASRFVAIDKEIPEDYYLYLTGQAGKMLKKQLPIWESDAAQERVQQEGNSSGGGGGQRTEYAGVFAPSRMFVQEREKPYRDDICLNGLWDFEPLSLPEGFKEGVDPAPALGGMDRAGWDKTPIRIPSPWNVNSFADRNGQGGDFRCYPSYPAAWESCKMGWLRKKFFVPAGWKGRRVQIHFEAVAGDVQVLVNGKPVGTHFGIFLPFDIDITDAVRPGGDNELCVGVRKASLFDRRGNYGRRTYQAGSFWGQHIAGIWQDVFVVALPDVHVAGVFVQPRVDADTLGAEVALVNERDAEVTVSVDAVTTVSVDGVASSRQDTGAEGLTLPGTEGLTLPGRLVRIPAHGETKVLLSAAVEGRLRRWSTDTPNLYSLVIRTQEMGRVLDIKSTRFGWRQVSLQGNQVLLNGKPIVMRGDSWHFLGIPQMSRRYAEAWYRAMRDAGLNAVRLHAQPYPSFYLDAADEMGILVLDESAMWASDGGPKLDDPLYWQDSKQHLTELILRDRNHPSVFGWSVSNEIMPVVRNVFHNPPGMADTLLKYDEEWVAICRRLDPTRTWISADGEDDGQGRFPVYVVHYGGMDAMNRAQKSGKPWGVGEAGNAYYGTPEQVAQTDGIRAYESFEGRMEGVAASSYRSLMAQKERNAVYRSVFNMVWYGLRPLPLGLKDTTRPPGLNDGVYFTHFKEGEPGVQPERLGPYCTTLNPGYDPGLPAYRTWPLFDAIRDAATGGDTASGVGGATGTDAVKGAGGGKWMADVAVATRQPVARSGRPGQVLFIDGSRVIKRGVIDKVTASGGTVVVWGVRPEMLGALNALLPARLELYPRKVSSLLPVNPDDSITMGITAGVTAADLYFSEMRPPEMVDFTLGGPLVEGSRVVLQACGTDWLKWNKQPEYAKTAMVLRSELEAKPSGAVLVVRPMGKGRLVVSTLPVAPRVDKAWKAVRLLLGNLGVALSDSEAVGKPILKNGELALRGAGEFWVLSPRSLDDLLSEPNIPIVNFEVESGDEVWLNDVLILRGKGVARALRLHQGWNHFVVKGSVTGRFTCNQPDFWKDLDSGFERP